MDHTLTRSETGRKTNLAKHYRARVLEKKGGRPYARLREAVRFTELQNLVIPRNFLGFREIPRKHGNSAATAKFRGSARNSAARGKLWSLVKIRQTFK